MAAIRKVARGNVVSPIMTIAVNGRVEIKVVVVVVVVVVVKTIVVWA